MLVAAQIVPAAQVQFTADVANWAYGELTGIKDNCKSFSHILANMMMMVSLADPLITTEQEQCFLSKLQSNN